MRGSRMAMAKKHWIIKNIIEQSKLEDPFTAKFMLSVAESLRKCSSKTIFDLAWSNYERLCDKDYKEGLDWKKRKKPEAKEYMEWRGEDGKGELSTVGLAKCKRIQCPLCCLSRSFLRRKNALDWANEKN